MQLLKAPNPDIVALAQARAENNTSIASSRCARFLSIAERGTLPVSLEAFATHTGRFAAGTSDAVKSDSTNLQNLSKRGSDKTLRMSVKAPAGYKLIACDSAQIEARTLAWLAGEQWLLKAFRDKTDPYCEMASSIYRESYETIYSWTKGNMGKYFLNSLIYAGFGVSGALLLSAPCAYALSRFKFFYNKALTNLLVLFLSIPQIMVVLPLYSIAVKYDLLNKHLTLLVLYICLNVPFCTFFLINFFATLSRTLEEAAVDGCTPIKTFFRIMLPLAQPGIITVGIFLFVNIWNEFFVAMIFATSSEVRPLAYGLYSLIQAMSTNGKWAELFASVMIVVVPTFILYLFLSEKIIAGVPGGGIKE